MYLSSRGCIRVPEYAGKPDYREAQGLARADVPGEATFFCIVCWSPIKVYDFNFQLISGYNPRFSSPARSGLTSLILPLVAVGSGRLN